MLGDKQEQSAQGGSTAIQAGGNVHLHQGLTLAEVREMCSIFLRDNFPRLLEEARQAAEQQVRNFALKFEEKLAREAANTDFAKFNQPDVQATINDAVQATARKANATHVEILSSLIVDRVNKDIDDYKETVLSEAVTVVPKLTAPQISLISFVQAAASFKFQNASCVSDFEQIGPAFLRVSEPGFNLSESQKRHIEYAGAWAISDFGFNVYKLLRENYVSLGFNDDDSFKQAIAQEAPTYGKLLDEFGRQRLSLIRLTSVGQAIAIAHISSMLGNIKFDYGNWLN